MALELIWSAIKKLERLLVEEGESLQGVEEQVNGLINDLSSTMGNLDLVEETRTYRYRRRSAAEIAHHADVAVDTFVSNMENFTRQKLLQRFLTKLSSKERRLINEFKKEIQYIRSRIAEFTADFAKHYRFVDEGKNRRRPRPPAIREEDAVGLERDVKQLLNEAIFRETQELSALWIVGMGGIGKTTLASLLYEHEDVAARFEVRAWVHFSAAFKRDTEKEVYVELIRQLGMEEDDEEMMTTTSNGGYFRKLDGILQGRTYFIVLDDVWSEYDLYFIRDIFPCADNKSRLVITSRNGSGIGTWGSEYIHEMKILNPRDSWELFLKKVFLGDRKCPKHLEIIGKQIVRKCDGLPLAIQEAGTKLAKMTKSEILWEEFLESMDLSETLASLELSYNKLPTRQISCFLRFAFFVEGTTIRANKLLQVWYAEGMYPDENYRTDEESGRQELEKLISQYLVQVKDLTMDNQVKNCEINYNLHRLAIKKAKEEILLEVITKEGSSNSQFSRHRAICCSREEFNYSTNQDKHLVSLFFGGGGNFSASPSYWKSFQLLKILDLEGFGLKTLPESVGTVITLKYLGLRNNYIKKLPCSLGRLRKLEILDIAQNFMIEVPDIIWEMESLLHLYMSDIICREPLKIGKLSKLETLTYVSVHKLAYEVSGLKMMTSLRKLGIEEVDENSLVLRELLASMAKLEKLEHLILRGFRFGSMVELNEFFLLRGLKQLKLDGKLRKLPFAHNFPPEIKCLSLINSCLDEDPMPTLEKLSKLEHLKLRNAFIGEQMVISPTGFAQLQTLCIEELWHLRSVQITMRRLKKLEIKNCPYLKIDK